MSETDHLALAKDTLTILATPVCSAEDVAAISATAQAHALVALVEAVREQTEVLRSKADGTQMVQLPGTHGPLCIETGSAVYLRYWDDASTFCGMREGGSCVIALPYAEVLALLGIEPKRAGD